MPKSIGIVFFKSAKDYVLRKVQDFLKALKDYRCAKEHAVHALRRP
jgi:hypothetical protein